MPWNVLAPKRNNRCKQIQWLKIISGLSQEFSQFSHRYNWNSWTVRAYLGSHDQVDYLLQVYVNDQTSWTCSSSWTSDILQDKTRNKELSEYNTCYNKPHRKQRMIMRIQKMGHNVYHKKNMYLEISVTVFLGAFTLRFVEQTIVCMGMCSRLLLCFY